MPAKFHPFSCKVSINTYCSPYWLTLPYKLTWYFSLLFYFFYLSICCRTSGSIIRHLLYFIRLLIHSFRSFEILFTLGSAPANLYFHILYFMYIFDNIYKTVASTVQVPYPLGIPVFLPFFLPSKRNVRPLCNYKPLDSPRIYAVCPHPPHLFPPSQPGSVLYPSFPLSHALLLSCRRYIYGQRLQNGILQCYRVSFPKALNPSFATVKLLV